MSRVHPHRVRPRVRRRASRALPLCARRRAPRAGPTIETTSMFTNIPPGASRSKTSAKARACARSSGGGSRRRRRLRRRARRAAPSRQAGVDRSPRTVRQFAPSARGDARRAGASARRSRRAPPRRRGATERSSCDIAPSPAAEVEEPRDRTIAAFEQQPHELFLDSISGSTCSRVCRNSSAISARCQAACPRRSRPAPDVHEAPLDRRGRRHLRRDEVRAPAAALAALEVAVRGRGAALAGLRGCRGSCRGTSSSRRRASRTRRRGTPGRVPRLRPVCAPAGSRARPSR